MHFKQTNKQQNKDLKYFILDGMYWSVMFYLVTIFLVPYIIYLGANTLQVGLIETLPVFITSFFSLISFSLLRRFRSKKEMVVSFCFFQAFICILIAITYFFFDNNITVWVIIFLYILFNISKNLTHVIYVDWIGKVFNKQRIGSLLSKKELLMNLVSIIPLFIGALILETLKNTSKALVGFTFIFVIAGIFRFLSTYFLNKMSVTEDKKDIKKEIKEYNKPIFSVFRKEILKDHDFRYFLLVVIIIFFSIYIATPYFKYYFISTLNLSYISYILLEIVKIISAVFSLSYWGMINDKYGSTRILKSVLLFIPFYPLALIVFARSIPLLIVYHFFDGMIFSGFMISLKNYFYQNIKKDLIHHTSFFTIAQGFAMFAATMFGSLIISEFTSFFSSERYGIWMVFIIASLFRFIAYLFARNIKDLNRRDINLPSNILHYRPIIFGLHSANNLMIHERYVLTKIIFAKEQKIKSFIKKEESEFEDFIKREERGFFRFFRRNNK